MEVLSPSEALQILKDRSSGQEMLLLVCKGQDIKQLKNFAIHYLDRYGKQLPADYLESIDNPEGQSVVMVPSRISDDLAAALRFIATSLADDVFAAGLINQNCPPPLSFAQAVIDGAAMNQFGWQVHEHEHKADGCKVYALPGYLMACETILRYLAKQQKTEKELPSNHTSEQQIAEKSARRDGKKQSKAEIELLDLIRWAEKECKASGGYADAKDKARFLQRRLEAIKELTSPKLLELINAKRQLEKNNPLDTLTITKDTCPATYALWKPDRDRARSRSRKGNTSEIAAIESGLQVRRDREGFLAPATTQDERKRDALSAAVDKILRG